MDPISRLVATGAAGAGEPPSEYWITRNTVSGTSYNIVGTATDSSDNVYCWGYKTGTPSLAVMIKKNIYGVTQWAKQITPGSSNVNTFAKALAFDGTYLYGLIRLFDSTTSERNINVVKFDTSGNLIWQKQYDESVSTGPDQEIYSITVDSSGNPIVGFRYYNGTIYHAGVMKLNSSGVVQWTTGLFSTGSALSFNVGVFSIATDSNNDVIVGGTLQSSSTSNFARTAFIAKLAGSTGSVSWSNNYNSFADYYQVAKVAVDSNDNIYGLLQHNYTSAHMDLVKYNSSGTIQSYVGLMSYWRENLHIDQNDYIYVASTGNVWGKYDTSLSLVYARQLTNSNPRYSATSSVSSTGIVYGGGTVNNLNRLPIDGSKTGFYTLGNYSVYTPTTNPADGAYSPTLGTSSASPTMTTTTTTFTVSSATVTTTTEYIY